MKFILALLIALPCAALGANPELEAQIRRMESAIALANQEQQSLHTQVQLMLEIRRAEAEQFTATMPQAGVAAPPMDYDDLVRLRRENENRLKQHADELTRLYARFRDIEQEKQSLRERLNQLLQRTD